MLWRLTQNNGTEWMSWCAVSSSGSQSFICCEVVYCLRGFFRSGSVKSYWIDPFPFFLHLYTQRVSLAKDNSGAPIPRIPWKKSDYGLKKRRGSRRNCRANWGKTDAMYLQGGVHLKEMQHEGTVKLIKRHNLCLKKKEGLPSVE